MKGLFTFVFIISVSVLSYGQVYLLNSATNNTTVNTCSGTFYDSGGPNGNYSNNENFTITFCPNQANTGIELNFPFASLQLGSGDQMSFYDGNSTAAPLIANSTAAMPFFVIQATAANTTGCITVEFTSNSSFNDGGWIANVSCVFPCQTILSDLISSSPVVDTSTGTIDICQGETVTLTGQGLYPQNNTTYAQSDATSTFEWTIEGQVFSGATVNYTFNNPGGFRAQLQVTDINGCESTNLLNQEIRVSGIPDFSGTTVPNSPLCTGDTLSFIDGNVTQSEEDFAVPLTVGDSIFLPDGNGVTYTTSVLVNDFLPGQLVTNISDIASICVNMEHSFMGDLNITITCPSGQTVTLHQYPGGGGTFLGVPVDNDATPLIPGIGFDYCWEDPSTNPTWQTASATAGTLPAGSYAPAQSFSGLIGCELNGNWTITIQDNLGSDNGFIFNWGVNFNSNIYPALNPFTPNTDTTFWVNNSTITNFFGDTAIMAIPNEVGTTNYIFSTINEFGCQYDTILTVDILPFTNPQCLDCDSLYSIVPITDTVICETESVSLDATPISNLTNSKFSYISGEPVVTGNTVEAELNISDISPNIVSATSIVSVCVDLEHQVPADLDIFLVAPSGQVLELSTDNGGFSATPNTYPNTCFTPTATNPINLATAPFSGTYAPEGNFNLLNGSLINGIWKLQVTDDGTLGLDGVLNSWSITFNNTHNFTYSWTPATGLSCTNCPDPTASPTVSTDYIVEITDNFGCIKSDTVNVGVIQQLPAPTVSCGTLTGTSIQITWAAVTNATGYEVNVNNTGWTPANGNLSHTATGFTPNQTVNFQVRATLGTVCDGNNGIGTVQCTTLPCAQVITIDSIQTVSCFGGNDGIAYISTTGSQGTTTFTLIGGATQNTGTFTNLSIGNYQVFATDGFNCVDTIDVIMTQPDTMTFSPTVINNICFGESNGSISVAITGGTTPYSYTWSTGTSTTNTLSNLPIGNYTVTVTDANNCQKTATYTITQPTDITLLTSNTNVLCFGGNSGTASVIATGGVGNYSYSWNSSPVQTTDIATNLTVGTYQVIVNDNNSCLDSATVVISQPTALTTSMDSTDASCFGFNDGSATVTIGGGTLNYTYNWSTIPVQDSSTAINLTAGTYYVTATDGNGCTILDTAIINQPTEIQMSFTTTQVTCFGLSDGSATVSPSGGVGSTYTYAWNTVPAQNLPTATNLPGGFFEVTVTDSTNCSVSDTVFVFAPVILDLDTLYSTPTLCYNSNEGVVGVQTSGGSGQKTYVWNTNPISTGAVQSNLFAGTYSVTATDQQGCQLIDSITVQQPDSIQATFVTDSLTCFQSNDGTATVSIIGGTANYNYLWSNGQTSIQATGLPSGFAIVTITDANNCVLVDSVFVPEPLLITSVMTTTQVSCNGDGDGTATETPSGGTMPYTYLWSDNQTSQTAVSLSGGIIYVTVSDSYGCTGIDSISVLENPALVANDTSFQVSCTGSGDGTGIILPQGGTGTYTYQWQGLTATTDTVPNLVDGMYYYTITDSDNCVTSDSVEVIEPTPLASNITGTPVSCTGDINGTATVTPAGGTAPYFYSWSNSIANATTVFSLPPGYTYVTVTDLYNCQIVDTVLIGEPIPVTATSTHTPTLCFGSADGTATVTPAGGVGNYSYNWIGQNQTTQTATGFAAGDYIVEVSDSNGCTTSDTVTVTQPTALGILPTVANTSCFGFNNGAIGVTPVGGIGGYTYQWSTSPNDTLSINNNLIAGVYSVTVIDANGCVLTDSFTVTQPDAITYSMGSTPASCAAGTDGSAFINVAGGTSPYNYNWNPTAPNADSITGLPFGNYAVTVTDNLGCTVSDTILVNEPTPVDLTTSQQPTSCFGVADGEAYVSILGGTPDYSILWSNTPAGVTDSIAYLSGDEMYFVTVTDGNGCVAVDSIFVVEPNQITAQVVITDETCYTSDNGIASAVITGGTAPYTYDWGTNTNNQTTQTATNLVTGVYTVLVSDINNCNTQATGVVNQPDSLEARLTQHDILCHGDATGIAIAEGVGGVGVYTYSWQTNTGVQVGDSATGLDLGVHVVTITDGNGCEVIDTVNINQPDAPLTATMTTENVDCFGDEDGRIEVTSTGGTAPYTYVMNNNAVTTSNVFIGLDAGNYNIVIEDDNGCTLLQQTTIIQPDEIMVDLGNDILLNDGDNAILEPEVLNGIAPFTYVWQPADSTLSCVDCLNPIVSGITFDKRYDFIVTDANGCTGEDFIMIRTRKVKDIFVANAFTPNNDGNNDALYVQGNPYVATVKTFKVFDRWGELVYEVTDVNPNDESVGWNGTYKGQEMNGNVFVWVTEVEFADGDVRVYQGSTMLIR
ncbi:MAG: proprotein convertase P-domain-containing protein [Saprospiraceae bacterium]